jgi:hypothetical protein
VLAPSSGPAPVEFLEGAAHWLGPIVHIDPNAVARETRRRVRLLDEIFPDRRVDTAAVSPVPRPPRERVWLTAPQWELLVAADGQRTPADLAQLLGRAGYATVQELRRLAAAGLLELPEARGPGTGGPAFVRLPRARGPAVDVRRPVVTAPREAAAAPIVAGPAADEPPRPAAQPEPSGDAAHRPPRLARRKPGARLPKELASGLGPPEPPCADEVLLKRIRTALRALR